MDSLREQWLILISTPIYFIIIGIELVLSHVSHKKAYTIKDSLANIYLMLLNSGIDPRIQAGLPCYSSILFSTCCNAMAKCFCILDNTFTG